MSTADKPGFLDSIFGITSTPIVPSPAVQSFWPDQNPLKTKINKLIALNEKLKLYPYLDIFGNITIGYGCNLTANGISPRIAALLLDEHIDSLLEELKNYTFYDVLDDFRKLIILDMAYNLGIKKLLEFNKMIAALENKDFPRAAAEMRNSLWYEQVKTRGDRLIKMMLAGHDTGDLGVDLA